MAQRSKLTVLFDCLIAVCSVSESISDMQFDCVPATLQRTIEGG